MYFVDIVDDQDNVITSKYDDKNAAIEYFNFCVDRQKKLPSLFHNIRIRLDNNFVIFESEV